MPQDFNNNTYKALVEDLINDAFYLDGMSRRGTVAKIRQYAEVVVRRILNVDSKESFTLGSDETKTKINNKNSALLKESVSAINRIGNKCTHTQYVKTISEKDVKNAIDNLFNLYAFLLIEYFEKYKFGTNAEIVHHFSILPPIIRYLTLTELYIKDPENIFIIDKLSLAILKAFDKEKALNWLEERKDKLRKISSVNINQPDNISSMNEELVENISISCPDMYELCVGKINMISAEIERNGRLYDDFESAIEYYRNSGIVQGDTPEIKEFNSIMEFLYLGRKSNRN